MSQLLPLLTPRRCPGPCGSAHNPHNYRPLVPQNDVQLVSLACCLASISAQAVDDHVRSALLARASDHGHDNGSAGLQHRPLVARALATEPRRAAAATFTRRVAVLLAREPPPRLSALVEACVRRARREVERSAARVAVPSVATSTELPPPDEAAGAAGGGAPLCSVGSSAAPPLVPPLPEDAALALREALTRAASLDHRLLSLMQQRVVHCLRCA